MNRFCVIVLRIEACRNHFRWAKSISTRFSFEDHGLSGSAGFVSSSTSESLCSTAQHNLSRSLDAILEHVLARSRLGLGQVLARSWTGLRQVSSGSSSGLR